jgi:hypothetical protein
VGFSRRHLEELCRPLSDAALYLVCGGNLRERRPELELADGRRGISHHGSTAVHVHDAEVHEARRLQVLIAAVGRAYLCN